MSLEKIRENASKETLPPALYKRYSTRGGLTATVAMNSKEDNRYPFKGFIKAEGKDPVFCEWTKDGFYTEAREVHAYDLIEEITE